MNVTRHYWGQAGIAGLLTVSAVLLARPILLLGTVGVGAWLLGYQGWFARQVARIETDLSVEQSLDREVVTVDEEVAVSVVAELEEPAAVDITVRTDPPVGSSGLATDRGRITIPAGERMASTTFFLQPAVAGRQQLAPATVTTATGLFESTYRTGTAPSLLVQPRRPRNVHVGASERRPVASFAEVATGNRNAGLEPSGVRQYIAGDMVSRIDWKTTARHRQPHVVEFEAEADVRTTLVVDHRSTMGLGPDGEQKLDYARQVALASLEASREAREPIGLLGVGDHGLTTRQRTGSTASHYTKLRTRLHDLSPTESTNPDEKREYRRPTKARQTAKRLREDDSRFASKLVPFLSEANEYVRRLRTDPFYATVRTELQQDQEGDVVVFLTDDNHQTEIYEAVRAARSGGNSVVAFLLPTVLFEPGGLTDLDTAYERYAEFDEFRRTLASVERVAAFEVGPRDRVEAIRTRPRRRAEA